MRLILLFVLAIVLVACSTVEDTVVGEGLDQSQVPLSPEDSDPTRVEETPTLVSEPGLDDPAYIDPATTDPSISSQYSCPEDAKVCEDGTTVVRDGPDCEFGPCLEDTLPPAKDGVVEPVATTPEYSYCTDEQKRTDVCAEIYQPVCAWYDAAALECFDDACPVSKTFSNTCFACQDERVGYLTDDECPE